MKMTKEEIIGIVVFAFFFLIGLFTPSTGGRGLPLLLFGGFGLLFGLPVFLYGFIRRRNSNERDSVLNSNQTIIIKELRWGHYEKRRVSVGNYERDELVLVGGANSANGWTVQYKWISGFAKPIKYVVFHTSTYNSVGDPAYCQIKKTSQFNVRVTGPIYKGERREDSCENLLYFIGQIKVDITSIDVVFMDGTTTFIPKNQIRWMSSIPWN